MLWVSLHLRASNIYYIKSLLSLVEGNYFFRFVPDLLSVIINQGHFLFVRFD